MTKYSELPKAQQAEVVALGYSPHFKEVAAEDIPGLMEKFNNQKDTTGLMTLTVQLQNLFIMKLWWDWEIED